MIPAPWNERNGRFSPLKAAAFAALFAPAVYILYQFASGALQPKPVTEMIHRSGDWAARLILLSLLVTPLRKLGQWPKLIAVRRMVGVAAFAYACAHLSLYVVDQSYDLGHVAAEIALRFYLTIGFVTLLGLGALAATSTDAMIRRLGAARWNKLHKIIYVLAALALFHYFLQSKADVSGAVLLTGFYLMLMLYRFSVRRLPLFGAVLASVTLGAGLTMLLEATWYALRRHYPFWEVLGANVDPDMFPRPAFYVALVGMAAIVVMVARHWPARRASRLAAAE
ncbi:MAG: sulfoxide reductase heme-binding subunit YedZ [Pseudomonadota bacterium]|nr:sulfoxide reductase heme-binding subunit YedZ [Pseudomonadota bacterium]